MASFLVVEVPNMTTPMAKFTSRHPEVRMDFFVHSPGEGEPRLDVMAKARGPPKLLAELLGVVRGAYPPVRVASNHGDSWFASFQIPLQPLDELTRQLVAFTQDRGLNVRWGSLHQGTGFVRVLVPDAQLHDLARDCRAFLARGGFDADVGTEVEDDGVISDWLSRVRAAVGGLTKHSPFALQS
jgi:hypothetical protein